jgi:hypothetical protein
VDIDICFFDEEIVNEAWYPEMSARLVDRSGKFRWMATPQAGTEQLYDLYLRAEEQAEGEYEGPARIEAFHLHIKDNPYLAEADKQTLVDKYTPGSAEYEVRIEGKFALLTHLVYPAWDLQGVHGVDPFPVPDDWTRYVVVDPGAQVCAVLFAAFPPPGSMPFELVLYDELYLRGCDARKFAQALADRCRGQEIEAFLIDHRAGRNSQIASGKTVEAEYSRALKDFRVTSVRTGHGFLWAADDVQAGIERVKSKLYISPVTHSPGMVAFRSLEWLDWEMKKYRHRRDANGLVSDQVVKKDDHLCDCVRMLCLTGGVRYNARAPRPTGETGAMRALAYKRARQKAFARQTNQGGSYIKFGPGKATS